jgi:HSP20 family protein
VAKIKPKEENKTPENEIFSQEGELVADVFETDSHFVVLATIAGVQMKDLDISVEKNMMVIKGQRPDPHENPNKKYFCQECWWGPFSRKIVLPENIETEEASAQIDKGLLTIKIPKAGDQKKNVEVS